LLDADVTGLIDIGSTTARLVRNGLRYRWLRVAGRPGRPQAISLEITHRCVCKCVMCNIWRVPDSVSDLDGEAWLRLLSSDALGDLRELDITGGEPFLRDDLVALVQGVCERKRSHLKRLRSIAITTNGVLAGHVVDTVGQMLPFIKQAGLQLVVVCALDAVDETHDRIRRYPGAWEAVDSCITGLVPLRAAYPELIIGVKTTVLPDNVGQLDRISAYAAARGLFTIISPGIFTGGRYLNPEKKDRLSLAPQDRESLARFYEGSAFKWSYHADALARFLRGGRMSKPCTCGFNYFFVRSTGEMHLCPLAGESVGNIGETPVPKLLRSARARRARARTGGWPECLHCTEPGLERYSLPYEGFAYLRVLVTKGPRSFLELHRHLGLDKYV
jgi:MoaA/NifB/PqqE/SkfB family radical SAM enzyme